MLPFQDLVSLEVSKESSRTEGMPTYPSHGAEGLSVERTKLQVTV